MDKDVIDELIRLHFQLEIGEFRDSISDEARHVRINRQMERLYEQNPTEYEYSNALFRTLTAIMTAQSIEDAYNYWCNFGFYY